MRARALPVGDNGPDCVGPGRQPRRPVFSQRGSNYYENMPMQNAAIFEGCKNGYLQMKNCNNLLFLLKT